MRDLRAHRSAPEHGQKNSRRPAVRNALGEQIQPREDIARLTAAEGCIWPIALAIAPRVECSHIPALSAQGRHAQFARAIGSSRRNHARAGRCGRWDRCLRGQETANQARSVRRADLDPLNGLPASRATAAKIIVVARRIRGGATKAQATNSTTARADAHENPKSEAAEAKEKPQRSSLRPSCPDRSGRPRKSRLGRDRRLIHEPSGRDSRTVKAQADRPFAPCSQKGASPLFDRAEGVAGPRRQRLLADDNGPRLRPFVEPSRVGGFASMVRGEHHVGWRLGSGLAYKLVEPRLFEIARQKKVSARECDVEHQAAGVVRSLGIPAGAWVQDREVHAAGFPRFGSRGRPDWYAAGPKLIEKRIAPGFEGPPKPGGTRTWPIANRSSRSGNPS